MLDRNVQKKNPLLLDAVVTSPSFSSPRHIHARDYKGTMDSFEKGHVYCSHCVAEKGVLTPLRFVSAQSKGLRTGGISAWNSRKGVNTHGYSHLDRYELLSRAEPHVCSHPVRFIGIENLAAQFNAHSVDDRSYNFILGEMAPPNDIEYDRRVPHLHAFLNSVRVPMLSSMADLTKFFNIVTYDQGLRERQTLSVDPQSFKHEARPVDVQFFDVPSRVNLLTFALNSEKNKKTPYAACLFKPVNRRVGKVWHQYGQRGLIPGQRGHDIRINGAPMTSGYVLDCGPDMYDNVRDLVVPQDHSKTYAALVFAKVSVSVDHGSAKAHLHVNNLAQIKRWSGRSDFSLLKDREKDRDLQKFVRHLAA